VELREHVELTHPLALTGLALTCSICIVIVSVLEIFVTHFAMVPRRVMFCKIVRKRLFSAITMVYIIMKNV
jgi:hypothetical protein